ncbi:Phosphate-binding protein PstS precursor [Roseovarius albus]|uniref:Phosphate-binding protein PstS n=1 Tax=Roseovarius albus TaxID=1247867 RepID=A0A1X6YSP2_9RHOB|nr:phosphate ABC transporter substrate-binding/OmpA family protein [Roseovarius albus]SLN30413.1 Phosphate-binding protein PstS precursor [Roseovarius albus]
MKWARAAKFAALFVFGGAIVADAQDVSLTSQDGKIEITGDLLGFDGEFYRVDTIYGELTVDGSGVVCSGPGCPDLENYVARLSFSGAPVVGRVLMPALLEAYASRNDLELMRDDLVGGQTLYGLSAKEDNRLLAEFTFHLTNTDEGFADLLANEADVVMAAREVRPQERDRARERGLGDLKGQGRSRVIALDALVPVVAPENPVQDLTPTQLSRVLAGEITNWQDLGGVDAPIDLHIRDSESGLGQATFDQLLVPVAQDLRAEIYRHANNQSLAEAVAAGSFALGITSRSELGDSQELGLSGECGFSMKASRTAMKTEDYPLTAPLFLYFPARRLPKVGREFVNFLSEPSAQLIIRRAGFVDQSPEEIAINAQGDRFANAIARAGSEVSLKELQRMVDVLTPLKRLSTTFRFEAGSSRLDAQSRSNVLQLAHAMEAGRYDARRLVFVGFSDGDGGAAANRSIAMRRATAVRQAVLSAAETADLKNIELETEAFGEALPMACDNSSWGRQINRRVEVWVR